VASSAARVLAVAVFAVAGAGVRIAAHAGNSLPHAAAAARSTAEQVCAACHGADGNSPTAAVPSLARQNADYLYDQLLQFAAQGRRRANGVMGAIAVNLSREQMRALADYFSYQRLEPADPGEPPLSKRGEAIYRDGIERKDVPACASCHGPRGEGLAPSFPRLAGQHARYLDIQLRQFRDGRRASDPQASMRKVAANLSDADIAAVAKFAARLR